MRDHVQYLVGHFQADLGCRLSLRGYGLGVQVHNLKRAGEGAHNLKTPHNSLVNPAFGNQASEPLVFDDQKTPGGVRPAASARRPWRLLR